MRKHFTHGRYLVDYMLFQRDSYRLHLFCLTVLFARKNKAEVKVIHFPDIRIPMKTKPIGVTQPKYMNQADAIFRKKGE
jgi:hypothetical protein